MSIAFGKIKKAITSLISHTDNISNPHSVTKSQVGLGNVFFFVDSPELQKAINEYKA